MAAELRFPSGVLDAVRTIGTPLGLSVLPGMLSGVWMPRIVHVDRRSIGGAACHCHSSVGADHALVKTDAIRPDHDILVVPL